MDGDFRILLLSLLAVVGGLMIWWPLWRRRGLARERLFLSTGEGHASTLPASDSLIDAWFLRRWLILAGFRRRASMRLFLAATAGSTLFGLLFVLITHALGLIERAFSGIAAVPGGMGIVFLPIISLAPWMLLLIAALLPLLYLRKVRRRRIEQIEQDLPIALDLMAALSESGLGFDAALERIFHTRLAGRPLSAEFRTFQADLLSGRPRVESLRRLSRRVDVPSMTILISALVQAEQLGMGVADLLRRQADDLRARRRERAHAFAMTLPVKLMFPLVICFLPGLIVWTLGPVFVQLFQIADQFTRAQSL